MSPTGRLAAALAAAAVVCVFVAPALGAVLALVLVGAALADAWLARGEAGVRRAIPEVLYRGVGAEVVIETSLPAQVRQPRSPNVAVEGGEGPSPLHATVSAARRGRLEVPAPAVRRAGPLGLARRDTSGQATEVRVYPDLPSARRAVSDLRRQHRRDPGLSRGPLGLGTEFEFVRDYSADDDIRQVNWRATARLGRPMSNQYRVEQDRQVVLLIDAGRLMLAPLGDRSRLDTALDAAAAVAAVADDVGDRCGALAFDQEIRARLPPRRRGGAAVVRALFDLEARGVDSHYELAFRSIGTGKRSLVVVFTDLLDQAAAASLCDAMPVITRRHAVLVAGARDPDLDRLLATRPTGVHGALEMAVAADVLLERRRVVARLRAAGADVVESPAGSLGAACAARYLRMKRLARL